MKRTVKTLILAMVMILAIILLAAPALAAPFSPVDGTDVVENPVTTAPLTEFFTLGWLGSMAGVVAFVALMVEVFKFLIPIYVNPKWYCLGWAVIAMLARALWLAPAIGAEAWFATFINMLLVAVAATGTFEYAIKPFEIKILQAREARQQLTEPGTTGDPTDGESDVQ